MKKQFNQILVIIVLFIFYNNTFAQQTICYPLASNFTSLEMLQPDLIPLTNPSGLTGDFTSLPANNNLCSSGNDMDLYNFEENAGLKFDNSLSFIDESYTIEFVFKLQDFPTIFDTPWLKILGFVNNDDGLFLYKTPFFGDLILQFWQGEILLDQCPVGFFNEVDWTKLTITRSNTGMVSVFVNCIAICSYDDSVTNIFVPNINTGNQIIFFQDDPAIIAAEASSGWVKNIRISDFSKSETEVMEACNCFCEELTSCETIFNSLSFSCDPDDIGLLADTLFSSCSCDCDTILINEIQLSEIDSTFLEEEFTCDIEFAGVFYQSLQNINACDSIVIFNLSLLENPYLQDSVIMNDTGGGNGNVSLNIAGGMPPYSYLWNTGDTTSSINSLFAGIYGVTVTDQNGCELLLTFEVDIMNALSEIPTFYFQIFPNPNLSGEKIYFHFQNTKTQHFDLEIFDVFGYSIFQKEILLDTNTHFYELDKSLPTGIYLFQIRNEEGRSRVEKIIIIE